MNQFIIVGCDLHDRTMRLKIAVDRGEPISRTWANTPSSRKKIGTVTNGTSISRKLSENKSIEEQASWPKR